MIKRKISNAPPSRSSDPTWLRLQETAEVEISSEIESRPIEAALMPDQHATGWTAEEPGEQTIRLRFFQPCPIKQVRVVVEERERERTQQFVLRAAEHANGPWRELVRQQFTFSPSGSTREQEDYRVDLPAVAALELVIIPDISGGEARASLRELRVA